MCCDVRSVRRLVGRDACVVSCIGYTYGMSNCHSPSITAQRHGARILDQRERELWMCYFDLGNEVEAADDGALHHAHGERADAMVRALYRQYDAARAALAEYRLSR